MRKISVWTPSFILPSVTKMRVFLKDTYKALGVTEGGAGEGRVQQRWRQINTEHWTELCLEVPRLMAVWRALTHLSSQALLFSCGQLRFLSQPQQS